MFDSMVRSYTCLTAIHQICCFSSCHMCPAVGSTSEVDQSAWVKRSRIPAEVPWMQQSRNHTHLPLALVVLLEHGIPEIGHARKSPESLDEFPNKLGDPLGSHDVPPKKRAQARGCRAWRTPTAAWLETKKPLLVWKH